LFGWLLQQRSRGITGLRIPDMGKVTEIIFCDGATTIYCLAPQSCTSKLSMCRYTIRKVYTASPK
jgi:hypothetical protein